LQVTDVLQLSCLSRLTLHDGRTFDIKALLQMPQLQHLDVPFGRISVAGLEQLTGLQQLTMLRVYGYEKTFYARIVTSGFDRPGKMNGVGTQSQAARHARLRCNRGFEAHVASCIGPGNNTILALRWCIQPALLRTVTRFASQAVMLALYAGWVCCSVVVLGTEFDVLCDAAEACVATTARALRGGETG
jgi:hypothetical protein